MDGARGRARTAIPPRVHWEGENHDVLLFSCISCFSWFEVFVFLVSIQGLFALRSLLLLHSIYARCEANGFQALKYHRQLFVIEDCALMAFF